MSTTGDLKDLPLADLLQSMSQNGRTGVLTLRLPAEREHHILFREGAIVAAAPLADGSLAAAVKRMRRRSSARREVAEALLRDAVADLFLDPRGKFEFTEGAPPRGGPFDGDLVAAGASVEPQAAVMEGSRRADEWSRISRRISGGGDILVRAASGPAEDDVPELTPEARAALALLDGRRDVDACAAAVPFGRFRLLEALAELLEARLVRPATIDEVALLAERSERAGDVDGAIAYYRRALESARNALPLRERLADLLERTGHAEEAAHERKLLAHARAGMGDVAGAVADYLRAADLAPTDPLPLERALELERARRSKAGAFACAKRLAARYVEIGLAQRARAIYEDLHRDHAADLEVAERLEDLLRRSGDERSAERVRKHIDDVESGRAAARAHARRRALWVAVVAIWSSLFAVQGVREGLARSDLATAHASTIFSRAAGDGNRARWAEEYRRAAAANPWTIAGRDAGLIAEGLERAEEERTVAAAR